MLRVLGLLVLVVTAAPAVAAAQGSLFLRGARAYAEGRFADAAAAFAEAYEADPDPTYLYHLGLSLEAAGDVEGAIDAYFRFVGEAPDAPETAEVEASIERLSALVVEATPPPDPEPEVEPDPEPEPGSRRTVSHIGVVERPGPRISPWPWVLAGGGVVVIVLGAIPGAMALSTHASADGAASHAETVALESDAQTQAGAATALYVVGSLIVVGGAAWGIADIVLAGSGTTEDPSEATARLRLGPASVALDVAF